MGILYLIKEQRWHTWEEQHDALGTDYKTNAQIANELKITPILDKLLEYKRSWIQHVNRMPRNKLPRVMKHYSPTGRRNHGRLLKRLLDTWDRNGSTSGPTPWNIYDDDDGDEKILGYKYLTIKIQRTWIVKAKVITLIIGTIRTISKSFRKYLGIIPGKQEIKEIQQK
jgi:hypothetical protein